jgi:hypothetical protein
MDYLVNGGCVVDRQVRQRRPKAENVEDDVQTELINVDGVLRHNLAQLLHCQKGIHTDMARLRDSKRELETDLRNKQAALEVDKRVLRDEAEDAANFGKSGSTGVGKMKSVSGGPTAQRFVTKPRFGIVFCVSARY